MSRRRRGGKARSFTCALLLIGIPSVPADAIDLERLVSPGDLIEGHADVEGECRSCHAPFAADAQPDLCLECHEEVGDDRRERRGYHGRAPDARETTCRTCHPEHRGRRADIVGLDREAFDHSLSDYPLDGEHRRLPCESCHSPSLKYRDAPAACIDCHRQDDPHRGQLGSKCASCHGVDGWLSVGFDHERDTGFALRGRHGKVSCALCHPNERYDPTPKDCHACHRLDDAHAGGMGKRCDGCHSAQDWSARVFEHDRDTEFRLEGAHRDAKCRACHEAPPRERKLQTTCISCHRLDDEHRGRNGKSCERCHGVETWKAALFRHDRDTEFSLDGAHEKVACGGCHVGHLYDEEPATTCSGCHSDDDVHKQQQGKTCERCHNQDSWSAEVFFDHGLTRFPLLGLHAVVACEECHVSLAFRDAETECRSCHAKDDLHERRLGVSCESCHNPNGWGVWRFDHDTETAFALHGAHEELDCHSCHRKPMTGETQQSGACADCHASADVHRGAFGRACDRCHVDRSWDETRILR